MNADDYNPPDAPGPDSRFVTTRRHRAITVMLSLSITCCVFASIASSSSYTYLIPGNDGFLPIALCLILVFAILCSLID